MKKELSSVLGIYNVSQKDRRSTCSALPHPDFSLSCFPALRDFALLSHLSLSSPKASPMNEYNDNISVAWSELNSFCSSSPDHFLPCSHSVENTSVLLSLLIDPKSKHGSPPQPPLSLSSPAMRSLRSLQKTSLICPSPPFYLHFLCSAPRFHDLDFCRQMLLILTAHYFVSLRRYFKLEKVFQSCFKISQCCLTVVKMKLKFRLCIVHIDDTLFDLRSGGVWMHMCMVYV